MKRSIHYKNILKTAVPAALCAAIILGTAACGKGSAKAEPSPSPSAEPTATPIPVEKVKVAIINDIDDSLNVRSEASTDSEILGTAEAGSRLWHRTIPPSGWKSLTLGRMRMCSRNL